MVRKKIIIAGAGGVGRACALMLLDKHQNQLKLTLADIDPGQLTSARSWIKNGLENDQAHLDLLDLSQIDTETWTPGMDLLLDCTPGRFAQKMAETALRSNAHYANLTEWTAATQQILHLVSNAPTGFALQTGLAPGFINQYARKSIQHFNEKYPGTEISTVKMRVGALSRYASSPSYYAFTWSPVGVSAEYLNESEVLKDFKCTKLPALSEREKIMILGESFEADLTSGGAGDLPHFYEDKIQSLDYKSLRYPGHFSWIDSIIKNYGSNLSPADLTTILRREIPFHEEDRILLYVAVSGLKDNGDRIEMIRHREVLPGVKNNVRLSAIQRTTAASLAQTAELLLTDKYAGPLLQSQYPLDIFLEGTFITDHYGPVIQDFTK